MSPPTETARGRPLKLGELLIAQAVTAAAFGAFRSRGVRTTEAMVVAGALALAAGLAPLAWQDAVEAARTPSDSGGPPPRFSWPGRVALLLHGAPALLLAILAAVPGLAWKDPDSWVLPAGILLGTLTGSAPVAWLLSVAGLAQEGRPRSSWDGLPFLVATAHLAATVWLLAR